MNAPRLVRAGYRVGILALAVTAVLAASACASPFPAKHAGAGNHVCADKLAQATVATVPDLASCFDPSVAIDTTQLKPFAKSWRYIGESADEDSQHGVVAYIYEITYPSAVNGMTGQILVVLENGKGLISGAEIAQRVV